MRAKASHLLAATPSRRLTATSRAVGCSALARMAVTRPVPWSVTERKLTHPEFPDTSRQPTRSTDVPSAWISSGSSAAGRQSASPSCSSVWKRWTATWSASRDSTTRSTSSPWYSVSPPWAVLCVPRNPTMSFSKVMAVSAPSHVSHDSCSSAITPPRSTWTSSCGPGSHRSDSKAHQRVLKTKTAKMCRSRK